MRIHIVTTVVAATVLGGAQAQSGVEIYGAVDLAVYRKQLAGERTMSHLGNGGLTTSFVGFRGKEDLGTGLSATFELTSWFTADTGSSSRNPATDTFWSRSAWVGLQASRWGAIKLGRQGTWAALNTARYSPFGLSSSFGPNVMHNYLPSATQPVMTGSGSAGTGDSVWSNAIGYETPVFGGLRGAVMAAPSENSSAGRRLGLSVVWEQGPFSAGIVYQAMSAMTLNFSKPPAILPMTDSRLVNAGASFDFGALKLFGNYIRTALEGPDTEITLVTTQVGASAPVGAGRVLAAWAHTRKRQTAFAQQRRDTVSIGYDYPLSRRTDIYGAVMYDRATQLNSGTGYALGIRHFF